MFKRLYYVASALLAAIVLSASAATGNTLSSATPTLFSVRGTPLVLAGGAQKLYPVTIDESQAFSAIFKGGMWLPNPAGGREYARYARHLIHDNGDWTFIGKVPTAHGDQSVVITFGKDAVFGLIPQASGYPLRVVRAHGRTLLLQTSGDMLARSPTALALRTNQDFKIPPRRAHVATSPSATSATTQSSAQQQTIPATTVDVMVAYTAGFVSEYGTVSAALTRINNLVDVTNQAYVDSQVNQQIRLVHTVQVSYPDNNSNATALDDITGQDGNGNIIPIPSSLQQIASLRSQYGADLVALVRSFDNATDGGCGIGWLVGGDLQPIDPSRDNVFGYSVVSDGSDAGYYCLDSTFAHELGHNMGNAHDRANASKDGNGKPIPGAYSYSFGFKSASSTGFSTIMAYGSAEQTPLDLFSNPNISLCQGQPCGVADNSPSSADNARSLNNTGALIAQFEATKVLGGKARNDVDGDGKSDLLFQNGGTNQFGYWLMSGTIVLQMPSFTAPGPGYRVVATGDFNGDGKVDIVWTSAANDLYMWTGNGTTFTSLRFGNYPSGWNVVGAGDVDGDGKADLLFHNPGARIFGYWLMNGAQVLSMHQVTGVGAGYTVAAAGDFNGDGKVDVVWTSAAHDLYMWIGNGTGFTSTHFSNYPSGWNVVGAGDVDGGGKSDLLFHNPGARIFGYWLMNGAQVLSMHQVTGVGAGYTVAATGDFNGDGRVDVVWTSAARDLYMWTGNGTGFASVYFANYPAGWQVIP